MKSFSILTLLLVIVIVALGISHVRMARELADAQSEVEAIRRDFGYIRIEDPSKLHISRISQHKNKLRIVVPPGDRYFLHLTETDATTDTIPTDKKPEITVALNGWADGAQEIFSYHFGIHIGKDIPKFSVDSDTDHFFTYTPKDWPPGISMAAEKSELVADPQTTFSADENILLVHGKTPSLGRGVMLWLEPERNRTERQRLAATKAEP